MTHVMIIYIFIYLLNIDHCNMNVPPQNINNNMNKVNDVENSNSDKVENSLGAQPSLTLNLSKNFKNELESLPAHIQISNKPTTHPVVIPNIKTNSDIIESGALMRGVFVFVGIAMLFMIYLIFKTYRKSHKKQVNVKKYGVRARRTDTEMEPLHLDDDEEDETVFEPESK
ncbi:hypothetical protein NQ317_001848 [Molorchus minor]|uniref:Uncharacterized protein n=1 Tax=Molorchus minor TaxID=1323400 RepID=A0ABQ9K0R5_9CUCU|nr:hypothetical protein NQ317_001848 [Molorchus minor]